MVNTPRRERQHKENTQVHQGRYAPLLGLQIESGEVPETVEKIALPRKDAR